MTQYNGHRSWNAWNVALWIGNDEPLYRCAMDYLQRPTAKGKNPTLAQATRRFMRDMEGEKTPDGAIYNTACVKEALAGLMD